MHYDFISNYNRNKLKANKDMEKNKKRKHIEIKYTPDIVETLKSIKVLDTVLIDEKVIREPQLRQAACRLKQTKGLHFTVSIDGLVGEIAVTRLK